MKKENRVKFTSSKNLTDKEFENLKKELKRVEETTKIGKYPLLDHGIKFKPYSVQPKIEDFLKFIEKTFEDRCKPRKILKTFEDNNIESNCCELHLKHSCPNLINNEILELFGCSKRVTEDPHKEMIFVFSKDYKKFEEYKKDKSRYLKFIWVNRTDRLFGHMGEYLNVISLDDKWVDMFNDFDFNEILGYFKIFKSRTRYKEVRL